MVKTTIRPAASKTTSIKDEFILTFIFLFHARDVFSLIYGFVSKAKGKKFSGDPLLASAFIITRNVQKVIKLVITLYEHSTILCRRRLNIK